MRYGDKSKGGKLHFSGQDTYKGSDGRYYLATGVGDPASGTVTPSVVSIDDGNPPPEGVTLDMADSIGLTPTERIKYEGMQTKVNRQVTRHDSGIKDLTSQLSAFQNEDRLLSEAIEILKRGDANTGVIANMFPDFDRDTIALKNAGQKLGLNIIQNTTFGALSAAEMRLAMQTGFPTIMDEDDLLGWAIKRQNARRKLKTEIISAIDYMQRQDPTLENYKDAQTEWQKQRDTERDARQTQEAGQASSGQDAEAIAWAEANPNDPRSAEIMKRIQAKQGGE